MIITPPIHHIKKSSNSSMRIISLKNKHSINGQQNIYSKSGAMFKKQSTGYEIISSNTTKSAILHDTIRNRPTFKNARKSILLNHSDTMINVIGSNSLKPKRKSVTFDPIIEYNVNNADGIIICTNASKVDNTIKPTSNDINKPSRPIKNSGIRSNISYTNRNSVHIMDMNDQVGVSKIDNVHRINEDMWNNITLKKNVKSTSDIAKIFRQETNKK